MMTLQHEIEKYFGQKLEGADVDRALKAFSKFKFFLNKGEIRAAEPVNGDWKVNEWVKKGILLGFKLGELEDVSLSSHFRFFDKSTYPLKNLQLSDGVRLVPGGSAIRDGAYVARGVVCMPPMYINVGAYVDEGTMVDSHVLVGSCAQIGKRVHLSAGAQIGGVLEPVGALPVIIEDDVFIGGNCGVYEGTIVKRGAVLAAGVILTGGTQVYDVVNRTVYRKKGARPLVIPPNAVVVPGSRPLADSWAKEQGLGIASPIIIKYRDAKTDASLALEEILR
ncbi:MAG TPA: 2,3,4,5-tetrahydropyridine-2,6-dicarboxylate N-succinyltransferase [Bacteroidota bacterium]|nr:2,3,4,5-tetrahydropyridine-2,6-dicarboxylate N-succinyltransferase [Bacteroidota bacterium]